MSKEHDGNNSSKRVEVVRTYLRMRERAELKPSLIADERVRVERVGHCTVSLSRYLYAEVGRSYHWIDRLAWPDAQLAARLAQASVSVWLLKFEEETAGYFELEQHSDGSTEIAYFGLLPAYTKRGLGKHLLTRAVEIAWDEGAREVWLHTCTLDDAAALPNYLKRGFQPFKRETYLTDI